MVYLAAVLAYPAPWLRKFTGALKGIATLLALNIVRIAILYFLFGTGWFDVVHDDIAPAAMLGIAGLIFWFWVRSVNRVAAAK